MPEQFEGAEPGVDQPPTNGREQEIEYRLGSAAMALTRSDNDYESMLRGNAIPRRRLEPEYLHALGLDPRKGAAIALDYDLALQVESVRMAMLEERAEAERAELEAAEQAQRAREQAEAAQQPLGAQDGPLPEPDPLPKFMLASEFLEVQDLHAPALLGTEEDTVLTLGGFLLMAGEGGAAKTTLTLDAIAHLCSGTPWLGIPVPQPIRALIIENEGTRPKFRQKLAEKAEAWQGKPWLENLRVYTSPWGAFSFASAEERAELKAYLASEQVQLVVADPLDSLGVQGVGSPDETRLFMGWLRGVGLFDPKQPCSYWILHHLGKQAHQSLLNKLSGDWGKHPDAVVLISAAGAKRTKLRWAKLRWATAGGPEWLPADDVTLGWEIEARGYKVVTGVEAVPDEALKERIIEHLREHQGISKSALKQGVKGDNTRIGTQLDALVTEGVVRNTSQNLKRPKYELTGKPAVPAVPPGSGPAQPAAEQDSQLQPEEEAFPF